MKKLLFIFLLFSVRVFADDTTLLQSGLTANAGGTYALPSGGSPITYHISGTLTVPTNTRFRMNGNFIVASQTSGSAINVNFGGQVDGGILTGPYNITTPGSSTGGTGIKALSSHVTVTNMTIQGFQGYGFVCFAVATNITFTNNTVLRTGYVAFEYDPESTLNAVLTVTGNTFDRSAISPTTIKQPAVVIRAANSSTVDSLSGVTFSHNIVNMPVNPTGGSDQDAAEGIELRQVKASTVQANTFNHGTISISLVRCGEMIVTQNKCISPKQYGIEDAYCHNITTSLNKSTNAGQDGIIEDGYLVTQPTHYSTDITHANDTITGSVASGIHLYFGTKRVTVSGCVISGSPKGINLQQSDILTISNTSMDGGSAPGSTGIYVESSPGNITISRGGITHFANAVKAYNTTSAAVVNNIVGTSVDLTGTPIQFASFFTNGAHYGTNVRFVTGFFTFPALAGVTYGVANFSPGASSNLPITYTTTGHHTSIVSGLIHITGTGTDTITATTTDTTAGQPLVISKKALTITADDKHKAHGSPNPTLTATYVGLVYSDGSGVVSGLVLATTAVTSSPVGTYPITASGATATNYAITEVPGTLTVTNGASTGVKSRFRHVVIVGRQ